MEHIGFAMRIAPDHIERYVTMHANVWPDLLAALARTGWTNYSLYLAEDGALVGYLESENWAAAQSQMSQASVAHEWSSEMDRLVVPGTSLTELALAIRLQPAAAPMPDVRRVCAMFPQPKSTPDSARGFDSLTVFIASVGVVAYGEYRGDRPPRWPRELGRPAAPLREVFNLEQQLHR